MANANQVPPGKTKKAGGEPGVKQPDAGRPVKPTSKAEMASQNRKAELTRFGKKMKTGKDCK